MAVDLNHLIVPARDKAASAAFLAGVLGLPVGRQWGPFVPVVTANGVSLEFADAEGFEPHHYAFVLTDDEFDGAIGRLREAGVAVTGGPHGELPGEVNHDYGGRGVYFHDPAGHQLEIMTSPYGDAAGFSFAGPRG